MTSDYAILFGLFVLVIVASVLMVRKGIPTTKRMCWGIFSLVVLSVCAIGLHWWLDPDGSFLELRKPSISFQNMGLGVLFLALATAGLMCAGHSDS